MEKEKGNSGVDLGEVKRRKKEKTTTASIRNHNLQDLSRKFSREKPAVIKIQWWPTGKKSEFRNNPQKQRLILKSSKYTWITASATEEEAEEEVEYNDKWCQKVNLETVTETRERMQQREALSTHTLSHTDRHIGVRGERRDRSW